MTLSFKFSKLKYLASITLPKSVIREKEGVVILPLRKWREIEDALEDLEMYHSGRLAKAIEKSRKEVKKGEVISLEELEKS